MYAQKSLKYFSFEPNKEGGMFLCAKIELIFYLLQYVEKSITFSVLWSEKNRVWSGKSQ